MTNIWNKITAWFTAQGGLSHGLAAIYLALVTLYGTVPAFTTLVNNIYAAVPSWGHQLTAALLGIAAFYWNTQKAKKP
jgi:hypothetical protein